MKTVLITGGTRGIGLSTAIKFQQEGWVVYVTSRKQENIDAVVTDHPGLKGFAARADDLAAASETCLKIKNEELIRTENLSRRRKNDKAI